MSGSQPKQPRERGDAIMPAARMSGFVRRPAHDAQKPFESESP